MAFSSGQAEMNVTPMIDILLVLIIIFMIIIPATKGQEVNIPHEPTKSEPETVRTVVIQLHANPTSRADLKINDEAVTWENLRARLMDIYKERAEKVAFVKADADLEFEPVAQVIDIAHAAGVENIGLMR